MRLHIRHETHYDYDTPLAYSAQRLHLWPVDFDTQKTVSWDIQAPGIERALAYLDGFGNRVHLLTFGDIEGEVSIIAEGVIDCTDAAGLVRGVHSPAPDAIFLRLTRATTPNAAIRGMAEKHFAPGRVLDGLHGLMADIHARVAYELGATTAHTTAAEAFADGRGVCQDHAHILIAAARSAGIPARYVTGYLVTGQGASSTAAHAWAEALVPDLGWVGFDAANAKCPTDNYVRVAAGIDAAGVAPIRGSRRGGNIERMRVEVRVEIAQQ
ncbi:transglutaminase domain-containing protein [Aestuariivirga sp.]|uniref:transglutaminase family protein n=1 Tax=Aestuariivirga sp. TaxID=2650926 RepID=UPI003593836C